MRVLRASTLGILLGVLIGVVFGVLPAMKAGFSVYNKTKQTSSNISDEIIRFHVRANSDSTEDQDLKMDVKDAVIEYISPYLSECSSVEESREVLNSQMSNIEEIANSVIEMEGYDYPVEVYFSNEEFPVKEYGDIVFPSGEYEALRIDIGSAEGKNWWCVMFPPLCFIDSTTGVVPDDSKEMLKEELSEEAYDEIQVKSDSKEEGEQEEETKEEPEIKIKVKFKIVEEIEKLFN